MTPVPPPLSISAFSAGHPRTTVDLTGHNSRLWLTRPDGERKKKQYTGLQVSQPPRKKKKTPQEFLLNPGNTDSTVFSQPHTEMEGRRQSD